MTYSEFLPRPQLSMMLLLLLSWSLAAAPRSEPHCRMIDLAVAGNTSVSGVNPSVKLWGPDQEDQWQQPACIPWTTKPARIVVTSFGQFEHTGNTDDLLARFAGVSGMASIRYWSVTRQLWKPLFKQSYAFDPASGKRRSDFELSELAEGSVVQVRQKEAYLPAALTMQWEILSRTPDRLVIAMVNKNAVKWMFSRIISIGDYEFFYVIERKTDSTWQYYNVSRLVGSHFALSLLPNESYINRAVAIFRYISGYPTDAEPPAAPVRQ